MQSDPLQSHSDYHDEYSIGDFHKASPFEVVYEVGPLS